MQIQTQTHVELPPAAHQLIIIALWQRDHNDRANPGRISGLYAKNSPIPRIVYPTMLTMILQSGRLYRPQQVPTRYAPRTASRLQLPTSAPYAVMKNLLASKFRGNFHGNFRWKFHLTSLTRSHGEDWRDARTQPLKPSTMIRDATDRLSPPSSSALCLSIS